MIKMDKNINLKELSDIRTERAYSILKNGNPEMISEQEFLVPASNPEFRYKVSHIDSWTCECPDFQKRCRENGLYCKHIKAIQLFQKLKNKTEVEELLPETKETINECPSCKSSNLIKRGLRNSKKGKIQRYSCKDCRKRFTASPIKYIQIDTKNICLVMDLYFKGLSLRDIQDNIFQFHNIKVSHESIRRYIRKFSKLMDNYVNNQVKGKLQLGNQIQCDEQTVKIGKEKLWNWNAIDVKTKYLVANNLSKSRYFNDIKAIVTKVKEEGVRPEEYRTDSLKGYHRAINEVFELDKLRFPYTVHVRSKGFKDEINTNNIERYHNEWRDFDKRRRGFGNMETAMDWNVGYRLYHNVIRKHQGLNGLTPLQKANIELNLGNNRWLDLLKRSLKDGK